MPPHAPSLLRRLPLATLAVAALLALPPIPPVPAAWNPFLPLDLAAEPTPVTPWKLARLRLDPELCLATLPTADLRFTRVPDRETGPGCGFANAVRLAGPASTAQSSAAPAFAPPAFAPPSFAATCPLAASWALFEAHTLQPAAQRHLGSRVVTVRHLGSYACRNRYHRDGGPRSAHATAEALDVAGFRLADGRELTLSRDWTDDGARGAFLRELRQGACRWFGTVLGPAYNRAHADHFHFEVGGPGICR